jgi:hypothetical protein
MLALKLARKVRVSCGGCVKGKSVKEKVAVRGVKVSPGSVARDARGTEESERRLPGDK